MKRPVIIGLIMVQLLLMGSAFVGGRMIAEQGRRGGRQAIGAQLPSQLPKEPMAGSGSVQKVQNNTITLSQRGGGPGGGGPGGAPGGGSSSSNTGIDVAVSADTKIYKSASSGGGQSQSQLQVQDAQLTDIKVGNQIMVWGTKSGSRITAEVIYIQGSGSFGPPGGG